MTEPLPDARSVLIAEQEKEIERLRLTDEEREVLLAIADDASYRAMEMTERVVRGLLERLK